MERLTKRDKYGFAHYPYCFEKCDGNGTGIRCQTCDFEEKICDKLAEYEDLEEQGLLLKLPCKVGTQVFIINHYWIDEGFICGIAEADDIDCFCFKVYEDPDTYTLIAIDDFEKGWFLTEQEAQAALEKMKGE